MSTPMPAASTQVTARVGVLCRSGDSAQPALAFIEQLGLEGLIVAEPAAGGSVVQQLEALRGLDFALVMLSADDLAASPGAYLGIGFLLGALARGRLCCLLGNGAAPVPELEGMPRHTLDAGGVWRLLVAREMRQGGLDVDMNKAL